MVIIALKNIKFNGGLRLTQFCMLNVKHNDRKSEVLST